MRGEKEEIEGELQGESLSLCRVGLHRVQLILPVNQTELAEKTEIDKLSVSTARKKSNHGNWF